MSLWKVDEKASTQMTTAFMTYLSKGLTKSKALRPAKLDYLSSAGTSLSHPFYWTGRVLNGQDGMMDLAEHKKPLAMVCTLWSARNGNGSLFQPT